MLAKDAALSEDEELRIDDDTSENGAQLICGEDGIPVAVEDKASSADDDVADSAEDSEQDYDSESSEPSEVRRSAWRFFSSEDLPQVSLREILGGDYLIGSFLRRNIWYILFLLALGVFYITNRYQAQQEIIEEENLRAELVEKKNYALTQYAELTMRSRQSSIENQLRALGDTLLCASTVPPFILHDKAQD